MVYNGPNGSRVVIQDPLYFRKIRDIGSETLISSKGEPVFDSPRLHLIIGSGTPVYILFYIFYAGSEPVEGDF